MNEIDTFGGDKIVDFYCIIEQEISGHIEKRYVILVGVICENHKYAFKGITVLDRWLERRPIAERIISVNRLNLSKEKTDLMVNRMNRPLREPEYDSNR